jgi:diketogulonate reductase-like aldo/keto reductase
MRQESTLRVPVVGQGTWRMGERKGARAAEVAALQLGLDLGMTLIDTAEMYANGGAEEVVGEAIRGMRRRRDEVFLVTKVLPSNASRAGTVRACERSLARLQTDRIDLYLLHWAGDHPLAETLAAFDELERAGKIRRFGVSNFDERLMARTLAHPIGARCAANQVLYNLTRRGIEHALLPDLVRRGVLVMAYSPLEEGRLEDALLRGGARRRALETVARRHGVTAAQVAIAWTIRGRGVVSIPKAVSPQHVRENAAAANLTLSPQDSEDLDAAFPPPTGPTELEMI